MPVKVLVVDDSAFMRKRIIEILEEGRDIEVVDVACDGFEAVRKAALKLRPAPVSRHLTIARDSQLKPVQLMVIAASTGGPLALQKILPKLSAAAGFPILLVQHMPGHFTPSFAERLNRLSAIEVREAVDGDILRPGVALLAPGGQQMELIPGNRILIRAGRPGETYKPSADVTFTSVAEHFRGQVLAVVMTGMGADGRLGAERLKAGNARIWVQDEASSTIYGMPRAVVEAGLADRVLSLDEIAGFLEAM